VLKRHFSPDFAPTWWFYMAEYDKVINFLTQRNVTISMIISFRALFAHDIADPGRTGIQSCFPARSLPARTDRWTLAIVYPLVVSDVSSLLPPDGVTRLTWGISNWISKVVRFTSRSPTDASLLDHHGCP
jgi:hypothetical protein